jgi:Fe-S-cluster-containing dehydrogenase component
MDPACVHTCTTRALGFGPVQEFSRERSKKASKKRLDAFMSADAKG